MFASKNTKGIGRNKAKEITTNGMVIIIRIYCWASLVAQRLKCLPAMWETWVQSLGREDPLEKETATHSSVHGQGSLVGYSPRGRKESDTTERFHFHFTSLQYPCLENSMDRGAWQATVQKLQRVGHNLT